MALLEVRSQMREISSKQDKKVNERNAELSTENLKLKVRVD